jgi:hypothetical protein
MPVPRTLEELAGLDHGLILITGGRGSGKTETLKSIRHFWDARAILYKHFGYGSPGLLARLLPNSGPPTRVNVPRQARGLCHVLVDEPDPDLRPEDILWVSSVVVATSEPTTWIDDASWIVRLEPGQPPRIEEGLQAWATPRPPSATVWERLLDGVDIF